MARLESIAIGGYYPTPPAIVELIVGMLDTAERASYNIVDPCAGEGAAVFRVAEALGVGAAVYTVELEATRHAALLTRYEQAWNAQHQCLHGDAFLVDADNARGYGSGANVLYLNPPYDLDPVHGRLEERFLERFTRVLARDGLLIFVVPFYALKASAATLATEYADLECYRFPDGEFDVYKQVVLFARRCATRWEPDAGLLAQVEAWATSTDGMPILGGDPERKVQVFGESYRNSMSWRLEEFDVGGLLAKGRPWKQRPRPGAPDAYVPHVLSELPVQDLSFRSYPLATPPRPAHIAAGIASGLFNGRRVSGAGPDLLVKGVFDREYKTVEQKKNKDGEVTALVQVQQPKLVTTVLDLESKQYRSLNPEGLAQLLEDYGESLMGVMREQCPVLYDPIRDASDALAPVQRKLFTAQAHAARALVRLLTGPERAAILLGEIGSGKTGTALTAAKTVLARGGSPAKVLVLCPPHLLTSWRNEAAVVVPEATVKVLENATDVDAFAALASDQLAVAVLSRETAKLGHGWVSVTGACPGCGAALPEGDLAKKRARCASRRRSPRDELAQATWDLALRLGPATAKSGHVQAILAGGGHRHLERALVRWAAVPRPWLGFDRDWLARTVAHVVGAVVGGNTAEELPRALGQMLVGQPAATILTAARALAESPHWIAADVIRALALLAGEAAPEVWALAKESYYGASSLEAALARAAEEHGYTTRIGRIILRDGVAALDGHEPGSVAAALAVLGDLSRCGKWSMSEECGEPLFQAVPEPRRVPLASYISKRCPRAFGLLILDEGHEYATDGSAQERAAHRLTGLGLPTILATGSIMNGYASSLFTNMWALSADFRREFGRDEQQRFIDRYGYRKIIVTERDKDSRKPVTFGSVTDRVERTERAAGDAPGVLPLFLFRHLLSIAVTLHKTDLALDLPPCKQIRHDLTPSPELHAEYSRLLAALKAAIKRDQFKEERSGKLFGQLSEMPSYLDRAFRDFEIRYPESLGSELVARAAALPGVHEKEQWMLDTLRAELAEGRNVMVFCWHIDVLPRLQTLIRDELGEEAPILLADKVPTGKRQDWIDAKIVKPKRRIMLANPVCIQTGLNNLVWFSSQIWIENPACNPTIFRQAIGRVDRIGQKASETRIHLPVYVGTLQEQLYGLLLRKVAVAVSADGLDPESALQAAGAGEDDGYLAGLSLGKQLWEMMSAEGDAPARAKPKRAPRKKPAPAGAAPVVVATPPATSPQPALNIGRLWCTRRADLDETRTLSDKN
jgi:RecA/RadA recombinase